MVDNKTSCFEFDTQAISHRVLYTQQRRIVFHMMSSLPLYLNKGVLFLESSSDLSSM